MRAPGRGGAVTGDRWYDDFRNSENRGLDVESTVERSRRTVDIAAVVKTFTPGEILYAEKVFGLWSEITEHAGIRSAGHAMLLLIDAELARRELERARTLAQFDAIAAENRPDPLPTGDTSDLRWSEISSKKP